MRIPNNCAKFYLNSRSYYQYSAIQKISGADKMISPLSGKKCFFFGDSIIHGHLAGISFADYIQNETGLHIKKYARNGASMYETEIYTQIVNADSNTPDFVIFDGLINDAFASVSNTDLIGTISDSYNVSDFASGTFCGEFEKVCHLLKTKYVGTNIIYLLCHKINGITESHQNTLVNLAIDICKKWAIPFVDIYNGGGLNSFVNILKTTYTYEGTHPNELGYRTYYVNPIKNKMIDFI